MAASTISCAVAPEGVRAAAAAHDRMLHEALRHLGERLKATVEQVRGVEGRQVSMDRRLAELDGRVMGLADEEARRGSSTSLLALGDRVSTLEKGQRTLALSTRRAMQLAMSSRKRLDEVRPQGLPGWADSLRLEHLGRGSSASGGGAWTPGASPTPSCLRGLGGGSTPSLLATQLDEQWLARIDDHDRRAEDHERRLEDHERRISSFGEQLAKRAAAASEGSRPHVLALPDGAEEGLRALTDVQAAAWSEDCLAVLQSSEARLEGSLGEVSRRLDEVAEVVEKQLRMPLHEVAERQQRHERHMQQIAEQSQRHATKAQELEVRLGLLRERVEIRGGAATGSPLGLRTAASGSPCPGAYSKALGLLASSPPGPCASASLSALAGGASSPFAA